MVSKVRCLVWGVMLRAPLLAVVVRMGQIGSGRGWAVGIYDSCFDRFSILQMTESTGLRGILFLECLPPPVEFG